MEKIKIPIITIYENPEDIPPLLKSRQGLNFKQMDLKTFIKELYELIKTKVLESK